MKKFLSILLSLVAILALAACGATETPEEKNEKQFKEYLAANDALTVEEFDALVTESEALEVPTDLFTNIKVDNIHLDGSYVTSEGSTDIEAYLWQNESKIYFAPLTDSQVSSAMYLDLATLEEAYDQAREEMGDSTMKPSEMIDAYLEEMMAAADVQITLDLETILGAATFKFEDFEQVESGKYALKNSALFEKIATISGGVITSADLEAQLTEAGYTINLYTYFDGTHINGFEASFKMTQGGMSMTMGLKIMLSFEGDVLNGYSVEANIPGVGEYEFSVSVKDEVISLNAEITAYEYSEDGMPTPVVMTINGTISQNNITLVVKQGNVEFLNCNINIVDTKLNDIHTFGINGTVKVVNDVVDGFNNTINMTITSGNSVTIPENVKALEATATNALESMGSGDIVVGE